MKPLFIITLCLLAFAACNHKPDTGDSSAEDSAFNSLIDEMEDLPCLNSVAGHDERDTIVGNFTGRGLDTLYVVHSEPDTSQYWEEAISYYAVSNNKKIPPMQLYGHVRVAPRIVFEGDLDGNGTDEWGYLHTWMSSQWRYYRVFTLINGEWRYLVESDKLDTPEWFRCSGQEIIEPAGKPGYVMIHYGTFGPDLDSYDTIEKVTFSKITD